MEIQCMSYAAASLSLTGMNTSTVLTPRYLHRLVPKTHVVKFEQKPIGARPTRSLRTFGISILRYGIHRMLSLWKNLQPIGKPTRVEAHTGNQMMMVA
jgi:hypothetical protein